MSVRVFGQLRAAGEHHYRTELFILHWSDPSLPLPFAPLTRNETSGQWESAGCVLDRIERPDPSGRLVAVFNCTHLTTYMILGFVRINVIDTPLEVLLKELRYNLLALAFPISIFAAYLLLLAPLCVIDYFKDRAAASLDLMHLAAKGSSGSLTDSSLGSRTNLADDGNDPLRRRGHRKRAITTVEAFAGDAPGGRAAQIALANAALMADRLANSCSSVSSGDGSGSGLAAGFAPRGTILNRLQTASTTSLTSFAALSSVAAAIDTRSPLQSAGSSAATGLTGLRQVRRSA